MSENEITKEKSTGELFADLASETALLFRQEATLATREIGEKASIASRQLVIVLVALLLGTVSLMTLIAALVIGLSAYVPAWASALIVGLIIGAIALGLYAKSAVTLGNLSPVPERTVKSLEENKSWLQQQTR